MALLRRGSGIAKEGVALLRRGSGIAKEGSRMLRREWHCYGGGVAC